MARERITLTIEVDLDPIPGAFHTKESAQQILQAIVEDRIPHYSPTVTLSK